ncbi:hypothetical protein [Vallitalea okinawensis]|uniref:hypothetical protein n=1 Tax=Vallitalea okinawensis TaxID=2078660 RepID=UPI001478CDA5|nr:hypothetical protein [Vallitalea okinawensis]
MEDAMQLLNKAIATIVFIIAITLFFMINNQEQKMLQSMRNNINSQRIVGEENFDHYEIIFYGYDIIAELLSQPPYKVTIDGEKIDLSKIDKMNMQDIKVDMKETYKRVLVVNQLGEIVEVVYHED